MRDMIRSTDGLFRNAKTVKAKLTFLMSSERYRTLKDFRADLQLRIRKFVEDFDLIPKP